MPSCKETPRFTQLGDTQIYAPLRSSSLDITSLKWGWRSGLVQQPVEFTEPVATPVDVDDMDVVEQAVEDRGGQDLIICEDFWPVPNVFVRRQNDGALLVAGTDEAEEHFDNLDNTLKVPGSTPIH